MDEKDRQLINAWIRAGAPITATSPGGGGPPQTAQQALVQSCLQCHGVDGPGSEAEPKIPRLAGQNENYLTWQLKKFKWRERIDPTDKMNEIALSLSNEQIRFVSRYFASPDKVWPGKSVIGLENKLLYDRGESLARQLCNSCHMNAAHFGRPAGVWLPVLRGQSKAYLLNQLIYFRLKERPSALMYEMIRDLSDQDLEAVAAYYSWSTP
jgi:cytochrome c553